MKQPVMTLIGAVIGYASGPTWRLRDHVYGDRVYVVLGGNGSGKSTLGRALCGIDPPSTGQILFGERDLATMSVDERRRTFHYIQQDPRWSFLADTAGDHLTRVESSFGYADVSSGVRTDAGNAIFAAIRDKLVTRLTDQEVYSFALYELCRWNKPVAFIDECPDFEDEQVREFLDELIGMRLRERKPTFIARHLPFETVTFPIERLCVEEYRQ